MALSIFGPKPDDDDPTVRANWLGRYLDVERGYDSKISKVLSDAAQSIDDAFGSIADRINISSVVRRGQLALAQKSLRSRIKDIFGENTDLIKTGQQDAAIAAVNAGLYDQRSFLSSIFTNSLDRNQYADSLRQTAARNIDAVLTRTLETEQTLSERVYHSQALANGLVGREVNRALAQGLSAKELAKNVKDMIDPNVPGGVSYAAMRLGRTEINNAFHAQSIHDAQDVPWINQMEWHLSKTHKEIKCVCERYAITRYFDINSVPKKPHPNCRCYVTSKQQSYDDFENALLSGQYNSYIDSVMGEGQGQIIVNKTAGIEPLEDASAKISPVGQIRSAPSEPEAVKWTGPKIAEPVKDVDYPEEDSIAHYAVTRDLEVIWGSQDFDEFKDDFRQGARIAQRDGYTGMNKKTKAKVLELQSNTDNFVGPSPDERSSELIQQYGKEIVARAVHSDPQTRDIWRGAIYEAADLDKVVAGQQVSLPLSSFTLDKNFAESISNREFSATWESEDITNLKDPKPIVFQLLPGAKTANIQGEEVAFGQFDVVSKTEDTQLGVTRVVLQQNSMIEANLDAEAGEYAAKRKKPKIPEVTKVSDQDDENPRATARSIAAVTKQAKRLAALFPEANVIGFDSYLHPKIAKEFVDAAEKMATQYPMASKQLVEIGFDDLGSELYGLTSRLKQIDAQGLTVAVPSKTATKTDGVLSRLRLNKNFAETYEQWVKEMKVGFDNGAHSKAYLDNPIESVVNHEFGHVIHNLFNSTNSEIGWEQARNATFDAYKLAGEPEGQSAAGWTKWTADNLTDYYYEGADRTNLQYLDDRESFAEAFGAVSVGSENIAEKKLAAVLHDQYERFYGNAR